MTASRSTTAKSGRPRAGGKPRAASKAGPKATRRGGKTAPKGDSVPPARALWPGWWTVFIASLALPLMRVANTPDVEWLAFLPLAAFGLTVLAMAIVLMQPRFSGDPALAGAVLLLCGLGIVIQQRMGAYTADRLLKPSALAYPAGMLCLFAAWLGLRGGRHRLLRRLWWVGWLVAMAVLGIVLVLGRRYRGAVFLPGNINPVEIAKPMLVICLAGFLAGHRETLSRTVAGFPLPSLAFVTTLAMLWGAPMALLVLQRDLGMLILMNGVLVVMLFAASRRAGYLVLGGVCVMGLVVVAMLFFTHGQARFEAWQDPFQDPTGRGWQVLQGLSAMYSGGLWGTGIGAGIPQAVPIVSSDFVYAAIAEELGYIGCALLLGTYGVLFARGFRAADVAADGGSEGSSLLAVGLTACLALQTLLNIAGVTKALPLTGITLPLISHGGSSMVTTLLMAGVLLALAEPPAGRKRAKRRK